MRREGAAFGRVAPRLSEAPRRCPARLSWLAPKAIAEPHDAGCVEISPVRCAVLRARGFETIEADFTDWASTQLAAPRRFDRIVMIPPFADGRARRHLEDAAQLVAGGGRLVAILPASLRGQDLLAGFEHRWSQTYRDMFAGTSACVAVLTADRTN